MSGKFQTRCRHGIPSTWESLSGSASSLSIKSKVILRLLCFLLFILHCSLIYADEIDGKALFKKGKEDLEDKRYEDAIKSLSVAEREYPLLGDYALLWLSEAYQETGNHKESLKTIRSLLKSYPNSPLRKSALIIEITEAQEVSEENIQQLFESFIKEYPNDTEINYAYAQWLKKNDRTEDAKSIFKAIYIRAGPLSEVAYSELNSTDIRVEDLIERASYLMKLREFKKAESAFRAALEKDNGKFKNEILNGLGYSLFRQKRYLEAAEIYKSANDTFFRIRSLYRAGERELFTSALEEFLKSGDKRAGIFLIAVASDHRGDGKIEEALKTYQKVIEQYPSEAEDALWGIGWTYFLTGEHRKAADVFTKLYEDYDDTRYLYWKARSLEVSGEDATDIYNALRKRGRDFYSVMSCVRKGWRFEDNVIPVRATTPAHKKFERIEILLELDLLKEVLIELKHISKNLTTVEDLLYIGSKFQDLGEYRYLVRLAAMYPFKEELNHIRYPHAYGDTIQSLSEKYAVDPFLILSVIREESMFDPYAKSTAGALGLMQLMPHTALRFGSHLQLGIQTVSEIYNIRNNIHIGTYYLSILKKEFGSYTYALAAYNAGEEKVKRWIKKGNYTSIDEFIEDIPYTETRTYTKRVITTFLEYKRTSADTEKIKNLLENL